MALNSKRPRTLNSQFQPLNPQLSIPTSKPTNHRPQPPNHETPNPKPQTQRPKSTDQCPKPQTPKSNPDNPQIQIQNLKPKTQISTGHRIAQIPTPTPTPRPWNFSCSFSSSLSLSSLELNDTKVYVPSIRARLGAAEHFCTGAPCDALERGQLKPCIQGW